MRRALAGAFALAIACYAVPTLAQKPETKPDFIRERGCRGVGGRSVTGSAKSATDKGLVVLGHEEGQADREWAFALDGNTRVDAGGQTRAAKDLRVGDPVTVSYTNQDGRIIGGRTSRWGAKSSAAIHRGRRARAHTAPAVVARLRTPGSKMERGDGGRLSAARGQADHVGGVGSGSRHPCRSQSGTK